MSESCKPDLMILREHHHNHVRDGLRQILGCEPKAAYRGAAETGLSKSSFENYLAGRSLPDLLSATIICRRYPEMKAVFARLLEMETSGSPGLQPEIARTLRQLQTLIERSK